MVEDVQIIELYWRRNEQAIAQTRTKYGTYCRTIAGNILHNAEDADECVNDTLLRVWNAIPPQRPTHLRLFLAKIVRNLAFDRYKVRTAQKRGGELPQILAELDACLPDRETVEQQVLAGELEAALNRFAGSLPPREGNVFLRRYFFAEPNDIIAKRYGMTANHVAVLLNRTRKKLKIFLEQEGLMP